MTEADYHKRIAELEQQLQQKDKALTKINAIRDDMVGRQVFNFSLHAYPLVAALNEAGYPGADYHESRRRAFERDELEKRNAELVAALTRIRDIAREDACISKDSERWICRVVNEALSPERPSSPPLHRAYDSLEERHPSPSPSTGESQ